MLILIATFHCQFVQLYIYFKNLLLLVQIIDTWWNQLWLMLDAINKYFIRLKKLNCLKNKQKQR